MTNARLLEKAGIAKANSLITALPSDADNLFVVLTAKQLSSKCKIISRASNESTVKKLKIYGLNRRTKHSDIRLQYAKHKIIQGDFELNKIASI